MVGVEFHSGGLVILSLTGNFQQLLQRLGADALVAKSPELQSLGFDVGRLDHLAPALML